MQKLNCSHCGLLADVTIQLPEDTVSYLQRLDYEIAGLQVLHSHALQADVPLEARLEIRRQFQELFAEYQMAKDEMWARFKPDHPDAQSWFVDFQTGLLHISERRRREVTGHA